MLELRSPDPVRQSADRRVALVLGYGVLGVLTFASVLGGGGAWAIGTGFVLALAGLPWVLAFGARWRLLDDALAGESFAVRGDRVGIWTIAPVAGALLALLLAAALGLPTALAWLVCLLGAGGYTYAIAWCEQRYERSIFLDLAIL